MKKSTEDLLFLGACILVDFMQNDLHNPLPKPPRRGNRRTRKLKKKWHKEVGPDIQTPIILE